MNERLVRHLICRLWKEAWAQAVETAEEAGLFEKHYVTSCGRALGVFRRRERVPQGLSAEQATAILRRHRRRLVSEHLFTVPDGIDLPAEADEASVDVAHPGDGTPSPTAALPCLDAQLVRFVRAAAEPPRASDVATMLLIAQSLPNWPSAHRDLLEALWQSRPVITICAEARGFENIFLDLLARGMLLPGRVSRCNGYELSGNGMFHFPHVADAKWKIVTFAGLEREKVLAGTRVGKAARSSYPVLGVSESMDRLPDKLVDSAHLNLSCGRLNADIVRRTIETVLGEVLSEKLDDIDFARIEITDLAIAIRPGIPASRAVAILRKFAAPTDGGSGSDGDGDTNLGESGRTGSTSSFSSSSRRGSDSGTGSSLIQPAVPSEPQAPRVETLTGYGEAQAWALGLKEDLALWTAGELGWEEMSTRILLHGPPGTGKTMFARALANTLQVPLLATSVARWLEPSYLGDVLRRMKRAFTEAEAHKPVILFIDEIDGIGMRRDSSRDYSDYWNSVVNQFLELLDGALKSIGVIVVGATNNQAAIDPAVLRSGRLERHVQIALPDVAALVGILRHHLRGDLEAVIAGAPQPTSGGHLSETDLSAIARELAQLPDDVLRRLAD